MTVTTIDIGYVSPFVVGDSGDFTEAAFEKYKAWAKEELDLDDPGLTNAKYDEAHANLICDIFMSSKGARDMKSEKIGDYGYTKDAGAKTSYRMRYEEIIRQWQVVHPSAGVDREDIAVPKDFKLDQQDIKTFADAAEEAEN